jgi:hypothetical protein
VGIGNLGTRASSFWGTRTEVYLIAKDKNTGLLSFIFIDILSNTLIALPSKGITNPNANKALFSTSSKGEVFLDIQENKTNRQLSIRGSIKSGKLRKLYPDLWVMGNTSIGYCKNFGKGDDNPFAVIFDPAEVQEALDIPTKDFRILENTLFPGLAEAEPTNVICFPFAQHYIADSPGCITTIKDQEDLVKKYNEIAEMGISKTFSARTIVNQIVLGVAAISIIALLLSFLL